MTAGQGSPTGRRSRRGVRALRERLGALVAVAGGDALVHAAPPVPVTEVFRRFWPYARPLRRWLAPALALVALLPAIDTAATWIWKLLVDRVLVPRDFAPFAWIAPAYLGLALVGAVAGFCDDLLSTWLGERFLLALRTDVFDRVQGLSLHFFERRRLGDLIARLTGDVSAIEDFVLSGVVDTISYVLRVVFFGAALFVIDWRLALVALTVAPVFWVVARRFARLRKRASREKRRRAGSIGAVAEESLSNVALVQAYNRQEEELARFRRESLGSFRAQMASVRVKALFTPLVDLLELGGGLLVIGFGTWLLSRRQISLGGLLAFLAYLTQLYSPIRGLSRLTNTIYSATASAERIVELLDARPAVTELPGALALGRFRGAIELVEVSLRYPGSDRDALVNVSLRARPGETLALVGASGAGKSSIARLLLRFYDPSTGTVWLDGRDARTLRLHDLRENVAAVLQETLIFDGTVRENIAYGRPQASGADIERAARAADAHEFVTALPQGYDTVVGQKGRRLSGGQRQRIAIARAVVRDAPVLLLDEPTTGLDAESSRRLLVPLRRLMSGRTTIVISHNLLTVREADTIVVLDAGAVIERGDHASLLAAGGAYAQLWELHRADREPTRAPLALAAGQG